MADDAAPSPPPAAGTKGALDEAAELLRAPPEGTVLRPYIRAARETVVGAVDAAGAQADDLRRAAEEMAPETAFGGRRAAAGIVGVADRGRGTRARHVRISAVPSARQVPRRLDVARGSVPRLHVTTPGAADDALQGEGGALGLPPARDARSK